MIHIVVDSGADLPADVAAEAGITVIPLLVSVGGETVRDTDLPRHQFYERLVSSSAIPQTSSPPIGLFADAFRSLTANGDAVLSISLSGRLSSTYSAARQAAQLVDGAQIVCVDSGTVIAPLAELALLAARAASQGATMDDLVALVHQRRARSVLLIGLDTLRYLEKGGRIGPLRAFLGTMLSVKPILEVREGEVLPVEQVRTSKRMPPRLIELARARGSYAALSVVYTTDHAAAAALADACAAAGMLPREQIGLIQAGPALGTHVGPGTLGIGGLLVE
ncbi:DegV family protein [Chloroflexia bacterium SDU3-3]|nr:DegV family protein [Chloroflexia bacterium SDU3-3]